MAPTLIQAPELFCGMYCERIYGVPCRSCQAMAANRERHARRTAQRRRRALTAAAIWLVLSCVWAAFLSL